jgi:hypothetical protein
LFFLFLYLEQFVSRPAVTPDVITQWSLNVSWTPSFTATWQTFYNTAARLIAFGRAGYYNVTFLPALPLYTDLYMGNCVNTGVNVGGNSTSNSTGNNTGNSLVIHHVILILLVFIPIFIHGNIN